MEENEINCIVNVVIHKQFQPAGK